MTLVSAIIRDAYRESNLVSVNSDPTEAEQAEGLSLLNSLVASVRGNEAGEQLNQIVIGRHNIGMPSGYPWYEQVPSPTEWWVPMNSRLVLNLTSAQTVYLDPNPDDGARFAYIDASSNLATYPLTINANGRNINGSHSIVANTNGGAAEFMYREDLAGWLVVSPLEADDTFPFPTEFDQMFGIGLAMRIDPRHSQAASDQSARAYERFLTKFKARYRQHKEVGSELALVRTSNARPWYYYNDSRLANSAFNSGYPLPWGYRLFY